MTERSKAAHAGDLLSALNRAGLTGVEYSARRRAEYSSDASLYRVTPTAVAFPREEDDVATALAVCRDLGVPVVARGAGTSIAGNAVGSGLVLDFSRHMRRIQRIDPDTRTALVQPGVVLASLQRAAAPHGLRFGPDPSTHNRCTLGGMIGNNACGSRALRYGRTSDNVVALDLLTGSGERLTVGPDTDPASSPTLTALRDVVMANLGTIRTELGRFERQISGYALEHLLPERGFNVARALVGAEGTCGVVLGATVRLVSAQSAVALVVLGYSDMAAAADAVPTLLPHRPVALEGLDARIIEAVRSRRGPSAVPELPTGAGWLFIELAAESREHLLPAVAALVAEADDAAAGYRVVTEPGEAAALWRIREDGAGHVARAHDGRASHAGWEDAAVPPAKLGSYLRDFEALMRDHGLTGAPYGHFGDGCVHVRIDFPLAGPRGADVFRKFLLDAAALVARYGGSMSGEHGDGRARSELLPLMYSADALRAFEAVKDVFDPEDILNPGVIVRPRPLDVDLRIPGIRPVRGPLALAYREDGGDFAAAVHRCTGVGKCRADTTASGGVMCPSFLATGDEKDSTRGRARVLQELVNGSLVRNGWRSAEVHEALDLCLACKGCASDCPTGVDMAAYKAEVLHQRYRRRIRPASHYTLGRLPRWARMASLNPHLVNWLTRRKALAYVGKRLAGIDVRRDLPPFAPTTFRQWFANQAPQQAGDPVLLWVDTFTNHFTPEVGIVAVRVLQDAGYMVRIPERTLCCGITWISTGQLNAARRILNRSVSALAPVAAKGVPIVGLEPSCTAVFRGDAAELLNDTTKLQTVAAATKTLAEVLTDRPQWSPPDLTGVRAVAQPHCHHHAVMGWDTDRALLERLGAQVQAVGSCCGLAGNFGVERGHYDISVKAAENALLPTLRAADPTAVVLADGFSCRTQLDHLADRTGLHLAQLLAASPTTPTAAGSTRCVG